MCCLIVTQEHTAVFAASEHRLSSERRRAASPVTLVCRHARPCHSLLAARAAAMATAEQWRSLCRQAMPVGEACAQCVCPSWRWRCTMQRFKLSVETPSAARGVFLCLACKVPRRRRRLQDALGGVGAVRAGLVWNSPGGPLRQRRSKTKKTYPTSIASRVSRADDHNQRKDHHQRTERSRARG